MTEGGGRSGRGADGASTQGVAAGAVSALLAELAQAPDAELGMAWEGALRPGARVGRFELVREIGRGGFGVVWEAKDGELGRRVAFKAVRVGGPRGLHEERLLREAEVAARLSHPNIVTLHDVGRSEHGPYLVLELLRGETLERRLAPGALPVLEALKVAEEVTRGVAHAHGQGVVHRDLKPGNVFLCEDGQVKVLDFGLAHAFGARKAEGGTPAYMAPEQWRGAPEDERTDVFSLGVVIHRMLCGELPFPLDGGREIQRPRPAPALELPGAPLLGGLVSRMLEKDPVRRPRDGAEVLAALVEASREIEDARAPPGAVRVLHRSAGPETVPSPQPPARGRTGPRLAAAAGLGALLAVAALSAVPQLRRWVEEHLAPRPRLPAEMRLAVIPFREIGGGRAEEAFAAGLVEILTNRLRQLEAFQSSLHVVSSSEVLREKVGSAKEARAAFGATLALTGSVHWERDRVLVATSLVDAASQLVLAARDVQAPRGDPSALQGPLVERAAEMLRLELPQARPGAAEPRPGAYGFYLQGRGYLQRYDRVENLDSALQVLDQALALDPGYALAHAARAEVFLRRHELTREPRFLAQARVAAQRALDLDGAQAPVHLTLGLVEAAAGEHGAAIARFEKALELEPSSPDALRELANACDAAGREDQAEATFKKAIELRPDWAAYKDLGVFLNRHGRLVEALPLFQRVVELTPDNYAGYANLGGIYLRLGRLDEAARALERSLALRPTSHGYANLGTVSFYQGRYAEAARLYRRAAELGPSDSRLWGNLADAERWAGMKAEAEDDYRRAIALLERDLAVNPNDAEAWSRMAMHQSALGEKRQALANIARAARLDPGNGLVLFRSALVYEEAGQRARALQAVAQAVAAGYSRQEIDKAPPLEGLRRDSRYRALSTPLRGASPR